jgi:hypothetical protein
VLGERDRRVAVQRPLVRLVGRHLRGGGAWSWCWARPPSSPRSGAPQNRDPGWRTSLRTRVPVTLVTVTSIVVP